MVRSVTWISESNLPCEPTANVILCAATFTIAAQLTNVFTNTCVDEFAYTFTYDDADLPEGYLDEYGPLGDDDIREVICEDCWSQWVKEQIQKVFTLNVSRGDDDTGDDFTISNDGEVTFIGGDGIEVSLDSGEVQLDLIPSTDEDNQLIIGTDGNPYVPISLYQPDGWYSIPDAGWSYLSANTITVPAGALLRFAKGDKLKITNSGTKYFNVIDVADTVLTVQGGSDYVVSNNPITSVYVSKDLSPVGFPSSFNFSTTYSGFSVNPVQTRRFSLLGRRARIDVETTGAAGTSNATNYTMTTVLPCETNTIGFKTGGHQGYDNGVYQENVFASIAAGGSLITLLTQGGSTGWTAAGDKSANFFLEYYI